MTSSFNEIAGYKEEVQEVKNLVNLFNNYEKYQEKGIRLPKGILFHGDPGVGKTLFSKVISKEIKRKFIKLDFTQANDADKHQKIKETFELAQLNAPSIVFIDEIDKLVPNIGYFSKYQSDSSRSNLHLLLQMLDGIESFKDVVVIATSNSINSLPTALVRSGRIDKHIHLKLPDKESREALINLYLNNVKYKHNISIKEFVESSHLLTGADISTIINQVFLNCGLSEDYIVQTSDVLKAIEQVRNQDILRVPSKQDIDKIAIHELGHFVASVGTINIVQEVSLYESQKSLGSIRYTNNSKIQSKNDIEQIVVAGLAGRAAEEVYFNETYSGSVSDLNKVYQLLEESVLSGNYGLEYIHLVSSFNQRSESTKEKIESKVSELIENLYKVSLDIVRKNKYKIDILKPYLIENLLLTGDQLLTHLKDNNAND